MTAAAYGLSPELLLWLVSVLFVGLTTVLWWLIKRYARLIERHEEIIPSLIKSLEKIDQNQYELYYSLQQTMKDLSQLKGAHESITGVRMNPCDPPSCMERRRQQMPS